MKKRSFLNGALQAREGVGRIVTVSKAPTNEPISTSTVLMKNRLNGSSV